MSTQNDDIVEYIFTYCQGEVRRDLIVKVLEGYAWMKIGEALEHASPNRPE